jgi:hypothetical protein
MSATKKVFIIGHSQGNINIQWALAFWPSIRRYVTGFSSLAGDFHGKSPFDKFKPKKPNVQELPRDRSSVLPRTSYKADANLVYSSRVLALSTSGLRTPLAVQRWSPQRASTRSSTISFNPRSSIPPVNCLELSTLEFKVRLFHLTADGHADHQTWISADRDM